MNTHPALIWPLTGPGRTGRSAHRLVREESRQELAQILLLKMEANNALERTFKPVMKVSNAQLLPKMSHFVPSWSVHKMYKLIALLNVDLPKMSHFVPSWSVHKMCKLIALLNVDLPK